MYKEKIKRKLDLCFAILMLPVLIPVMLVIGGMILLEDKGPIFYTSKRLGKNGSIFKMYKFRTMKVNAPDLRNDDGSTYNSENDIRVTKVGKMLRRTSMDELPQIINVLKNEMSFIGPRPDLPEHIMYYNQKHMRKLQVLPGITGYNQAYYRNSVIWKDRLRHDVYYVNHMSFWLDIKIFIKTIEGIISKRGIYTDSPIITKGYRCIGTKYIRIKL